MNIVLSYRFEYKMAGHIEILLYLRVLSETVMVQINHCASIAHGVGRI
jgi:hypothetical protein